MRESLLSLDANSVNSSNKNLLFFMIFYIFLIKTFLFFFVDLNYFMNLCSSYNADLKKNFAKTKFEEYLRQLQHKLEPKVFDSIISGATSSGYLIRTDTSHDCPTNLISITWHYDEYSQQSGICYSFVCNVTNDNFWKKYRPFIEILHAVTENVQLNKLNQ